MIKALKAIGMVAWLCIGLGGCGGGSAGVAHGVWNNSPFWTVVLSGAAAGLSGVVLFMWFGAITVIAENEKKESRQ